MSFRTDTMWKYDNFSATENSRESIFGESRGSKIGTLTISEPINFDFQRFSRLLGAETFQNSNSEPLEWFQ